MKPTIKMIADHAGVSRGTVDRVLHGRPNVNPSKRKKIEEALKTLNYSPDRAARALALKTKGLKVGVLLPNWGGHFASEVSRGLDDATRELGAFGLGVEIFRCQTDLPEECIAGIDSLLSLGVRGIAICAKNSSLVRDKILHLTRTEFPVITFNSDIPASGRMCFVGQDEMKAGRIACAMMLKMLPPHSRILIVCGNLEFAGHKSRVDGFIEKYSQCSGDATHCIVAESFNDYELTYRKVRDALEHDASIAGVYMANDGVSGCVQAIKELGRTGTIRIVCHDLPNAALHLLREKMVDLSIEQNMFIQGVKPATILAEYLIDGKKPKNEITYTHVKITCEENIESYPPLKN